MNATAPTAPDAGAEAWTPVIDEHTAEVRDENGLIVALVFGKSSETTVRESTYLLAAAPQLREALERLAAWNIAQGHHFAMPRALAEDIAQAVAESRPPP